MQQKLNDILQHGKWTRTTSSDAVAQFQFGTGQQQLLARPEKMTGPGWAAVIDGHCIVS